MRLVPPVTIDQLNDEWEKDCNIDFRDPDLDLELLKLSSLHSKYCRIRSHHKQTSFALDEKFRNLKELRREWIEGKSTLETLEKYGWQQYQGNAITMRTAQESKLEHDPELTKILLKKKLQDLIVEQCDLYLKELNGRNFALRGVIDNRRFLKGND